MPTCRDMSELATDMLERKLSLRDWLGVKFHLSRCQACRNYVDQLRKTIALLAGRTLTETPAEQADRIAQHLPAPAPRKPGQPPD